MNKQSVLYSKNRLDTLLLLRNIKYVFIGDSFGGQPSDLSCYTNGFVDYTKVREKEFFQKGLKRLQHASEQNIQIDEKNNLISQDQVLRRLRNPQESFLDFEQPAFTSRKQYIFSPS